MNQAVIQPTAVGPPPSVAITDTLQGLEAIRDTGCAAVILARKPMLNVNSWLQSLEADSLPRARVVLRPDRVHEELHRIADVYGTPAGPERSTLVDDIAELSSNFAALMKVEFLRLRLDVVTTNACRKFHIDAVTARLICTYRGQTTQLGEAEQGQDPDACVSAPLGSPIILRGTNWPEEAPMRLRHRSPPIEGSGETRLLLVLDPIYDPEEEA
ncbi:MAG: DUF1826 domain-containing protein [Shimia sp.]|uniref:DUF1826 domain-containing protein n=1 Tax=Shimia sp. TaxID=1954381 RepID=UPI0040599BA6